MPGAGGTSGADAGFAAAAGEASRLAALLQGVPLPPQDLPGWESSAADGYAVAVRGLADQVAQAAALLRGAAAWS